MFEGDDRFMVEMFMLDMIFKKENTTRTEQ